MQALADAGDRRAAGWLADLLVTQGRVGEAITASAGSPRRRICLPEIFVCPNEAPCLALAVHRAQHSPTPADSDWPADAATIRHALPTAATEATTTLATTAEGAAAPGAVAAPADLASPGHQMKSSSR
jgi:hypothetical protein